MQPTPPYPPVPGPSGGNPATLGAVLILVFAVLMLAGVATRSWFTMGDRARAGLTGFEICLGDDHCVGGMWGGENDGSPEGVVGAAYLGLLGGLAAVVLNIVVAAMALARKTARAPILPAVIVNGVALLPMAYFFVKLSSTEGAGLETSWGGVLAMGGALAAGLIGLIVLGPIKERERSALPAMPVAAYGPPACPSCRGPADFVAQYQRWYCGRCQRYL